VHVRSLGNWTRALHAHALARRTGGDEATMEAQLDGPYGAPAEDVFRTEVAVLVGAGIGVTPFASVLASLLARSEGAAPGIGPCGGCTSCGWRAISTPSSGLPTSCARSRTRDTRGLFDLRMWITSARADAAGGTLGVALDLLAAHTGRDPITGLRARARFGQPDWDALLDEVAKAHAGAATGVFFCGPHGLAPTLRRAAASRAMRFHEEQF
jgi:predicted ferric reductase